MTMMKVHLLMVGLGFVTYLLLAGAYNNRNCYSRQLRRKWWLGAIAGVAVALSPFSRIWHPPANAFELLTQSLLVAAICLSALLLYALIRRPIKSFLRSINVIGESKRDELEGYPKITINAESRSDEPTRDMSALTTNNTSKLEKLKTNSTDNTASNPYTAAVYTHDNDDRRTATVESTISQVQPEVLVESTSGENNIEKPISAESNQTHTTQSDVAKIESILPVHGEHKSPHKLAKTISRSSAANDQLSIEATEPFNNPISDTLTSNENLTESSHSLGQENVDLSGTDQLFAKMREQNAEFELPGQDELLQAKQQSTMDELDFDTDLIRKDKSADVSQGKNTTDSNSDIIEEAEVVEADNSNLEFGDDLTGAYAHPSGQTINSINDTNTFRSEAVPETLDDAIIAAKVGAVSLQAQAANLEDTIVEIDGFRESSFVAARNNVEQHTVQLAQSTALLSYENEARQAAEEVIAAQNEVIDRAKRQQRVFDSLLKQERERLAAMQIEVDRSRKMARTAAHLARKAAVAQQETRSIAMREQSARLKSQESTRKAVTIARNAIDALAAEERKRENTTS